MYSVLLVDDESHVVDSLAQTIDWPALGIDRVAGVYSASEALRLFRQHPFDIVITDLKMPGMDGLELIQQLRGESKRVRCIILTGYADFQYARQAIDYRVDKYLLKPIRDDLLMDTVGEITRSLSQADKVAKVETSVHRVFERHIARLRFNALMEIGRPPNEHPQVHRDDLQNLGLSYGAGDRLFLVVVSIDAADHTSQLSVHESLNGCLCDHFDVVDCKDNLGNLVFIARPKQLYEPHDTEHRRKWSPNCLNAVGKGLELGHGLRVRVETSKWVTYPDGILDEYRSCLRSLRSSVSSARGYETRGVPLVSEDESVPTPLDMHDIDIEDLMRARRWDDARASIESLFARLRHRRDLQREYLVEILYPIVSGILRIAHRAGGSIAQLCEAEFYELIDNISNSSVDSIETALIRVFDTTRNAISTETNGAPSTITESCREYVDCNLGSGISVQSIADSLSLHPTYLSDLYKRETGENLSAYIFRSRMEAAARLLTASTKAVREIGRRVGYPNPAYFSAAFRKHFGVSPRAFRAGER